MQHTFHIINILKETMVNKVPSIKNIERELTNQTTNNSKDCKDTKDNKDLFLSIQSKLLSRNETITEKEIAYLIAKSLDVLMSQPSFLELESPINICGDIHGQFNDLIRIFNSVGYPSEKNRFLFLGDYVDRGNQSLECICLLMTYKLQFPNSMFLLRGKSRICQYK